MRLFFHGCLFHKVTGLYCPGCGGTRAFLYLIHGHPLLSLWYHPFVIYMLFMLLYYVFTCVKRIALQKRSMSSAAMAGAYGIPIFKTWPLWGALVVIAANFALKNMILLIGGVDPLP